MANIQTEVACNITPLITADAETFQAEYTWPGGVPTPTVVLETPPTTTSSIDVATLAATDAVQSYQFTANNAEPYVFVPLAMGLAVDGGTLTETELNGFWKDQAALIVSGPDYSWIRTETLSQAFRTDPSILSSRLRSANFSNIWGGAQILSNITSSFGPSISLTVDTWVSATGCDAYPYIKAVGWPSRVANIGALRLPGLFQNR